MSYNYRYYIFIDLWIQFFGFVQSVYSVIILFLSFQAWKAFTEMRQEVSLTSKLQHPCIVSFIGITVRPKLLMALELAPFGSLRTVLDTHLNEREPFNKYRDKDKIFDSLFSKDLTFKMVYQVVML